VQTNHLSPSGAQDKFGPVDEDPVDLDAFEERAAIRQYDGGQPRLEAETCALADVAAALGQTPDSLRHRWFTHPDAQRYLDFVARRGSLPLDAAALGLGWTLERTWAADARLRACGILREGKLVPVHVQRTSP
jgi:hypothetical protein